MTHKANLAFVLPSGLALSGVVTWMMQLGQQLAAQSQPSTFLKYRNYTGMDMTASIPPQIRVVDCNELPDPANLCTESDVVPHVEKYRRVLPSVFLPNWSHGTYATCALLSKEDAAMLRVIGYAHSDDSDYYELLYYYEPLIHFFVAVSDEIAAKLSRGMPHRVDDILVRPYAVKVNRKLKRRYSAAKKPLQLMYAGRLVEQQKRVSRLVHLAKCLAAGGVNFELRIVGDGPQKANLSEHIAGLDDEVRRRVKLVGNLPVDEMPAMWQSSDVSVLVSEYEGTSISMLEAMANGCVPVVTQVSGASAVIVPGVNGFMTQVGNLDEMVQVLRTLDRDRTKLEQLGAQAKTTIVERYSYEDYVQWFLTVVENAWQMLPRPWPAERPILPRQLLTGYLLQRAGPESIARPILVSSLSSSEVAQWIPFWKMVKALRVKIATKLGLRWLRGKMKG
jgi:glycosyltransferase involved in cell wall biosynthesis